MSPRIYSYDEMREIVAADRKAQGLQKTVRKKYFGLEADELSALWTLSLAAGRPYKEVVTEASQRKAYAIASQQRSFIRGITRRSFIRGTGAAVLLTSVLASRARAAQFSTYMGYISVKDPTFGATGNGSTNDTAAVQASFNYAYGSPASPHGNSGRFSNLGVYTPNGNYSIQSPLYLAGVAGGHIFGLGTESTTLSFTNPNTGNTVIANGICPLIMTNGVSYMTFENMTMGCGTAANSAGVYFFEDGTQSVLSTAPMFRNILFSNFDNGILAGYQSSANCENGMLENVQFNACAISGLRVVGQNTLNWQIYGGSSGQCGASSTWVSSASPGNGGAAYSCVSGGMSPIVGMSSSGNHIDVVNNGFGGTTIIGGSSESNLGVGFIGTHAEMSDLAWRPTASNGTVFCDAANAAWAHLHGVFMNPGSNNGACTLVALGNTGTAILDSCEAPSGAAAGVISGTTGSKLYLRGNSFSNASVISGYTGTVAQNI